MYRYRFVLAATTAVLGCLQAWDSGVLLAGALVQALVALAIAAPAAAIAATRRRGTQMAAVAAAFALLTVARVLSPVSLNTLHLAAFFPAVVILFVARLQRPSSTANGCA